MRNICQLFGPLISRVWKIRNVAQFLYNRWFVRLNINKKESLSLSLLSSLVILVFDVGHLLLLMLLSLLKESRNWSSIPSVRSITEITCITIQLTALGKLIPPPRPNVQKISLMLICLFTVRWIIHGEFQYRLRQVTAARDVAVCNRDATTAEKLSETKFWVPTQAFRARPKAGLGVGCGRGSGGMAHGKLSKTQMLNLAFWWLLAVRFPAFWKLRPRSWGRPIHCWFPFPQTKSWGTNLPSSLQLLRLWFVMIQIIRNVATVKFIGFQIFTNLWSVSFGRVCPSSSLGLKTRAGKFKSKVK